MNRTALVAATALVIAACSSGQDTTTTVQTTTTTTIATTTTIDPAVVAAATCDALKVAAFDLESSITTSLADLDVTGDPAQLSETEIGVVVVESLVAFYDQIASLADDAPEEIAADLVTVATVADPWRQALTAPADELEATLQTLDPTTIDNPETTAAVSRLAVWSEEQCGAPIAFGPEDVVFSTVFAAMFGALGDAFTELGSLLGDPLQQPPTGEDGLVATALEYGDDPVLDDLHERCGTGDGEACTSLFYAGLGEYELWGQTCGASIPLRSSFGVDCLGKFASGIGAYGDDFVLDSLWDGCAAGDAESCDNLFAAAPFGSAYEQFGASCGSTRQGGDATRPCAFVASGEPYGYGDDLTFDALWDSCSLGDTSACSDLFFQTPIDSAYEAFGRLCGDMIEATRLCDDVAAWLGGPVG